MLILVLLSLGGALGALSLYRRQTPPRQLVWKNSTNAESTDVQDQRPLREKARDAGQYKVTERPPDLSSFNNLDEVTRRSAAVVIATANRNVCSLSQNGKTVTIDYEMKVEHSYKGSLTLGQTISVSLPGGLTKFPDGTSAEIRTPWFKKMINGKTYLLYLSANENRPFTITGGPRGVFEIPTDATTRLVTSHSMIEGDPMRNYNQVDVIVFLREVKQAVTRTK
jgi:hypothetical protein